ADTDLIIEVEKDFTHYGDEITFGGGKEIRDGMGQSSRGAGEGKEGGVDQVMRTAVILERGGMVEGGLGDKEDRVGEGGRGGRLDRWGGVDRGWGVGGGREGISGENLIATAGGVDSHIHFISPQQV